MAHQKIRFSNPTFCEVFLGSYILYQYKALSIKVTFIERITFLDKTLIFWICSVILIKQIQHNISKSLTKMGWWWWNGFKPHNAKERKIQLNQPNCTKRMHYSPTTGCINEAIHLIEIQEILIRFTIKLTQNFLSQMTFNANFAIQKFINLFYHDMLL